MNIIETYPLTDRTRIAVAYDPDSGSMHPIRDWEDTWSGIGIRPLRWSYHLNERVWTRGTNLDSYIDELLDLDKYDDVADALNYNQHAAIVLHLKGATQSDWLDLLVYSEEPNDLTVEQLKTATEELRAYFAGEVYIVAEQTLLTWTSDQGDTREEWQNTQWVISNVYFTDGTPNETEARECLGYGREVAA